MTELGECLMCGEPVLDAGVPIHTLEGPRTQHRECALREVLGGIGHHIAHEWWCEIHHDPDAGFTRHESALMVAFMYKLLGDAMIMRDPVTGVGRASEEPTPQWVVGMDPASDDDEEWGLVVLRWAEGDPPEYPPPASPG
jgi:hypothetical protein